MKLEEVKGRYAASAAKIMDDTFLKGLKKEY